MPRMRWGWMGSLVVSTALLALCLSAVAVTAQAQQEPPAAAGEAAVDGQEYVVQAGDWLSTLSLEFFGRADAYPAIIDATNAKAETDPRYIEIIDPDWIEVGQLLWIPADAGVYGAESAASSAMTSTAAVSSTVTVTGTGPVTGTESMTGSGSMTGTESITGTPAVTGTGGISDTDTVSNTDTVSPSVRFVSPQDGDTVPPQVEVEMAAAGITIEPAGEINDRAGHFHILIDTDFVTPGELIPFDEQHRHFGQGQLTTTLELEPGVHVLRLQVANGAHLALAGEAYTATITVTVAAGQIVQPSVRFVSPQDGDTVPPVFDVEMAAEGIVIEPAGEIHANAGHFHILVDRDFVAPGELVPFDEHHLHFGQGQLTTTLELEPGEHRLRLQVANGAHLALAGAQYQDSITVTVAAQE